MKGPAAPKVAILSVHSHGDRSFLDDQDLALVSGQLRDAGLANDLVVVVLEAAPTPTPRPPWLDPGALPGGGLRAGVEPGPGDAAPGAAPDAPSSTAGASTTSRTRRRSGFASSTTRTPSAPCSVTSPERPTCPPRRSSVGRRPASSPPRRRSPCPRCPSTSARTCGRWSSTPSASRRSGPLPSRERWLPLPGRRAGEPRVRRVEIPTGHGRGCAFCTAGNEHDGRPTKESPTRSWPSSATSAARPRRSATWSSRTRTPSAISPIW